MSVVAIVAVVAVIPAAGGGSVQDVADVPVLAVLVEFFQFWEESLVYQAGPEDEDCAVHELVDDLGIGHDVDRRTVDDDEVVPSLQGVHGLTEPRVGDELGRVRRNGAYRDDVHGLIFIRVIDDVVEGFNLLGEVVTEALLRTVDCSGKGSVTEVAVDQEDLLFFHCKTDSEVKGKEGLTGSRVK